MQINFPFYKRLYCNLFFIRLIKIIRRKFCAIINMSNNLFILYLHSLKMQIQNKKAADNKFYLFRTKSITITARQINLKLAIDYSFILKICSLINVRPYFSFQKCLMVHGLTIKFILNTITNFIPNTSINF